MAASQIVNGVAALSSGTGGSGALELLGYSLDGVKMTLQDKKRPVYADTGGGPDGIPVDVQRIGKLARLEAKIVVYDETVLAKLRKDPGAGSEGVIAGPGTLMGQAGLFIRMLIASPDAGLPWNFPTGWLGDGTIQLSTERNLWLLEWFAIAYIGNAASAANTVLYNRVTS